MWSCYIKPTRRVHSSGFRCFKIGYCTIDKHNRVDKKIVLGTCFDIIRLYDIIVTPSDFSPLQVTIDITRDGYIRLFNLISGLHWEIPITCNASLKLGLIDEEWCESKYKEKEKKFRC